MKASIIVTSYNYARFLPQAIDSALGQTYPDVEVIVVDDGSTDGSRDVIARYGSRIVPVLKANGGQASAFNAGFARSVGDVVIFLDSDDVLMLDAVARAAPLFATDRSVVKVHWPLRVIDAAGRDTGALQPPGPLPEGDLRERVIRDGPAEYTWPPTSGNAWSRRFLAEALPVPEAEYVTCPDSYLSVLAPLRGTMRRLSEPAGMYRLHGENNIGKVSLDDSLRFCHQHCALQSRVLATQGLTIPPATWEAPYGEWVDRLRRAAIQLRAAVPDGARFLLADEDQLRAVLPPDLASAAVPFIEDAGEYGGPPDDDAHALDELERMIAEGVHHVAIAWPAFWWLEYYTALRERIATSYDCHLSSPELFIYTLRRPT